MRPRTSTGSSPLTRGKPFIRDDADLESRLIPAHAGKTGLVLNVHVSPPAHPRSRGENPNPSLTHKRARRLIPAHAGKTCSWSPQPGAYKAHPRSRGENLSLMNTLDRARGSSPLTRGKLETPVEDKTNDGLIPAHAGKTPSLTSLRAWKGAHPRSRGENAKLSAASNMF